MTEETVSIDLPAVMGERRLARADWLTVTACLSLIVAVSTAVRVALASTVPVPTIFPDELGFWELGRGIGESGRWLIGGEPVHGFTYAPLYPLLIAPIHLVTNSLVDAYALTKILNALVMSLAAVPAYFLARKVASVRGSLVAAGLAVLVPSAVYTTHVMSETLSYPLFLCALLAMSAALRQRSLGRHAIAVGLMALTVLTRTEMVALIPAFACAILLLSWTESRTVSGRPFWRTLWSFKWAWLVYGVGVLVLLLHAAGASVGYPDSVPTGLPEAAQLGSLLDPVRPEAIPMNVVLHIAELDLYSGIIPFAAFVLVAFSALAGRDTDRSRMEFAAVGVSAGMWLIAMAATYETTFKLHGALTTHVFDRYDFYVVPLFVIALVVWIEDGLPRPPWITVVALAAALLPLALPLDVLIDGAEWGTSTSTVGVVPLVWASELIGDGLLLKALLLFVTSVLATAFLRAERAHGWVLVRMCAVVFCMSSVLVTVSNLRLSERLREDAGHNALDWIDDAVGPSSDVAIVWPGRETNLLDERTALREAEFFNRSIGPVYDLEAPLSAGFPSTGVTLRDDNVVTAPGRQVSSTYVLAHESLGVLGNRIASDTGSGLVLYRVAGPVRVMR